MLSLVKGEALAYLKLGMLAGLRDQVVANRHFADLGVVFVPGVAANGAQFLEMKRALEPFVRWFDSFEYWSLQDARQTADKLSQYLDRVEKRCGRLLLVTHSLGGVLGRMVLQKEEPPRSVAGFVAICSPLHGTWRSRLAPHPQLRALSPDGELIVGLTRTAYRLERWRGSILTIGTSADQFVKPSASAFLEGHDMLPLDGVAHAGSLFDERVHQAVSQLAERLAAKQPATCPPGSPMGNPPPGHTQEEPGSVAAPAPGPLGEANLTTGDAF